MAPKGLERGGPAGLAEALQFAAEVHGEQTRRGREAPYVSHLMQVAGLVFEHGGDLEQAIAGLLHDAIEDCAEVDEALVRKRFGPEVARIVVICTDTLDGDTPDQKSDWLERKRQHLVKLRAADVRARLVVACDKLHNLTNLATDLRTEGPATLERFRSSPEQTRWYFEQVRVVLGEDLPPALQHAFDERLEVLRRFVASADPGD